MNRAKTGYNENQATKQSATKKPYTNFLEMLDILCLSTLDRPTICFLSTLDRLTISFLWRCSSYVHNVHNPYIHGIHWYFTVVDVFGGDRGRIETMLQLDRDFLSSSC